MKIKSINQRGFLLGEETLKIIIAVIAIGFLVYFLSALYFNNVNSKKLEHAKSILSESEESIEKVIEQVKSGDGSLGQGNAEVFEFNNPSGWSIFSFTSLEEGIPNSCAGQSCVCVCDDLLVEEFGRQVNECSDEGACLVVEDLNDFERIKIEKGVNKILIKYNEGVSINEF